MISRSNLHVVRIRYRREVVRMNAIDSKGAHRCLCPAFGAGTVQGYSPLALQQSNCTLNEINLVRIYLGT